MKPFLKWAGNKFRIIESLKAVLPQGKRLIEPFTGSAAVFLNTDYPRYLLAEKNPDLINLFKILRKEGAEFIEYVRSFFTEENQTKENYYALRDEFNTSQDIRLRAAIFIYLNKHGFNGLCRYNSKGIFNVPLGKPSTFYFPKQELLYFQQKSRQAKFLLSDFRETMQQTKPGDVVYCDPPYAPLSETADFTAYHSGGFGPEDQAALAAAAEDLVTRGIPVVISNHDTPFTREIYKKAQIETLEVQRNISRDGNNRKRVKELLAVYLPWWLPLNPLDILEIEAATIG